MTISRAETTAPARRRRSQGIIEIDLQPKLTGGLHTTRRMPVRSFCPSTYKVDGFIGWTYYGQKLDTTGCVQIGDPELACLTPGDNRIVGNQDTHWNAPRAGLSAETIFLERLRVSADFAYLPWTDFSGRDNHILRPTPTFFDQRGNGGGGLQVEGMLSYFLTSNFSVGVGARYWAMWTKKGSDFICSGCGGPGIVSGPELGKYSIDRRGSFLQAFYKFD